VGVVADYLQVAIARARTVIAEVNEQMPRTCGDSALDPGDVDHVVYSDRPLVSVPPPAVGLVEARIGAHVAALVPPNPVLQLGLGKLGYAVAQALQERDDIAIHGGVVGDWLVDLAEAGALDNAHKPIDPDATVTGTVVGTRRLYDFVHENPAVRMRPLSYTHAPEILRRFDRLISVNSALQIDLTGQANAEIVNGCNVGAVGGQVDFVRAAVASPGGRAVLALPATAKQGALSRIVPRFADGVVTTPRCDVDVVVTEHGIADLRGVPLSERARRLIAIADHRHRDALSSYADDHRLY
jgi:acyl-CoA hydrolase